METFTFEGYESLKLYGRFWESNVSKAVVLMVHGFGEHSERYIPLAEYFLSREISVMAYDKRGHGHSEGKRGLLLRWEEHRGDACHAVAELARRCPTLPMFILGHSLGGTVVLDYTLSADTIPRGLIISAPALGKPGISPILLAVSRILSAIAPRLTVQTGLNTDAISRDPEICQAYRDDPLVHGQASARLSTELTKVQKTIFAGAHEINCPLLLCYGSEDQLAPLPPINEFFERVGSKDKVLKVFEKTFHEPHNDYVKDEVFQLYADWILAHV